MRSEQPNSDNASKEFGYGRHDVPALPFFNAWKIRRTIKASALDGFVRLYSGTDKISSIKLSGRNCYFIKDPEYVKFVFSEGRENFARLVISDPEKYLRVLGTESELPSIETTKLISYLPEDIGAFTDIFEEELGGFIRQCSSGKENADKINIETDLQRLMLKITARSFIAPQLDINAESLQESTGDILEYFRFPKYLSLIKKHHNTINNSMLSAIIPAYVRDSLNYMNEMPEHLATELLNESGEHGTVFRTLVSIYKAKTISFQQVLDELKITLIGSSIPTAETLTFAMHFIDSTSGMRKNLEKEIMAAESMPTTPESLRTNYPIIYSLLLETLRLYPPNWIIQRFNIRSDSIGNYYIPENSWTVVSPFAMHRDAQYWEDPLLFRPERFAAADSNILEKGYFLPLGFGPNNIKSLNLLLLFSAYVLVYLLKNIRLTFYKSSVLTLDPSPILKCRNIMLAKIEKKTPRNTNQ